MTGAYTREATEQNINWLLAANPNGSYCFFIIDIDNFKQANDLYGHIFGDSCIKQFVQLLKSDCREQDVVGRIGGDEFVIFSSISRCRVGRTQGGTFVPQAEHCV